MVRACSSTDVELLCPFFWSLHCRLCCIREETHIAVCCTGVRPSALMSSHLPVVNIVLLWTVRNATDTSTDGTVLYCMLFCTLCSSTPLTIWYLRCCLPRVNARTAAAHCCSYLKEPGSYSAMTSPRQRVSCTTPLDVCTLRHKAKAIILVFAVLSSQASGQQMSEAQMQQMMQQQMGGGSAPATPNRVGEALYWLLTLKPNTQTVLTRSVPLGGAYSWLKS